MFYCKHIIAFLLIIVAATSNGQGYHSPEPRMPNNLIRDFIHTHMVYPETAIANNEEGTVVISFQIDKSGNPSNIEFDQSVSETIDSAALKLFRLILWEPASYLGEPVDGQGDFKIKYNIRRYASLAKKRGYDKLPEPYTPVSSSLKIYNIPALVTVPNALVDSSYQSTQEFIVQNLKLPDAALKLNLRGEVHIRFVIEPSGLPSNIMVIKPLGGGCTEEAIRVVQMLRWMPGIKDSEAVRTCYNLTFTFDPADVIKQNHIPNQSNSGI